VLEKGSLPEEDASGRLSHCIHARPVAALKATPSSSGRSGGRTEEVSNRPRATWAGDFGEFITQCGRTLRIGEGAQGRNLGRAGLLEREDAPSTESRNAVEHVGQDPRGSGPTKSSRAEGAASGRAASVEEKP
jgi:hypothetical protein